jgi:hypothetical protein
MLPFVDRQSLSRKANRPAVRNVPRRDDWSTINTPDDRFGQYAHRVADQARYNYEAPQRAWDNLQHSHRVALAGGLDAAGEKQFKQDRRDWNRKFKYTPVGIMASGVDLDDNPFGAQDLYHDMSAQLHFDAPKLMDRMYPFSRGIGRLFNAAVENIGPLGWLNRIIPKRDPIVPENVLAMRDRFSPADILKGDIASYPVDEVDLSRGTAWYGPYNEDWEKLQSYLRGDIERDEDIERIFFDTQPSIIEETDEMDEFMSGNIGILNPLQPNDIFEESETIDITDGAEEEIITETVEKNPWIMRIFGNDVKGLRGYLWDLGIINPNSDMYKKTDQLGVQ